MVTLRWSPEPLTQHRTKVWAPRLSVRVAASDLLVLCAVVFGTQAAWLGLDTSVMGFSGSRRDIEVSYTVVSLVIICGWLAALHLHDTRSYRILGAGPQEYGAIARATLNVFGLVAIFAFLLKIDVARGYILIAFPLGLLALFATRSVWRGHLRAARREGRFTSRVLLIGSAGSTATIARELGRAPEAGYRVVGACVQDPTSVDRFDVETRAYRGVDETLRMLRELDADTIVVTSGDVPGPDDVKALSWGLLPGSEHLVVAPSLVGIGGPRIHTRPVAGLPLIHVETPRFEGRKLLAKRAFDLTASGLLLALLSPVLIAVALAVRMSSPGPVLFHQDRVGIKGQSFTMFKFRTMSVDAEDRLAEVQAMRNAGNDVMFKMKDDPRVTPIGRILRRYSLDELPQLLNVLRGDMSLVGPRPPLRREVDTYQGHVGRRFLVKPGITGLWQVSGRSSLDWADTVRLDLYYVENWSLTGDLLLLWRTVSAVAKSDGAY